MTCRWRVNEASRLRMHCFRVLNCGWMRISVTSESDANWINFSPVNKIHLLDFLICLFEIEEDGIQRPYTVSIQFDPIKEMASSARIEITTYRS